MSEPLDPQTIYNCFAANYMTSKEAKSGLSDQTKEYLRQQLEAVTKEKVAEEREAKRQASLANKRASKKVLTDVKEETT